MVNRVLVTVYCIICLIISSCKPSQKDKPLRLEKFEKRCEFSKMGEVYYVVDFHIKNISNRDIRAEIWLDVFSDTVSNTNEICSESKTWTIKKEDKIYKFSLRCYNRTREEVGDTVFLSLCYRLEVGKEKTSIGTVVKHSNWILLFRREPLIIIKPSNFLKFQVLHKGYEKQLAEGFYRISKFGRLDYKIENVGSEPIRRLEMRTDWYKYGTKEMIGSRNVIVISSFADAPLKPGYLKSDYITAPGGTSKGMKYSVDIHLSFDGYDWELIKKNVVVGW